uniref:NADH dehydrogenase subunit 6 n=1 Tax=Proasellus meridianus TaxID=1282001 RepID=A0A485MAE9_9CRUS|nr:NADH dehydrogenase subunit 6 [Proasellus meridianus]
MLTLLALLGGLFLASNTPHMLISSLLLSTLLVAIVLGMVDSFPWLAYMLFLIFLGGVLILFTYISSLSSNHLFSEVKLEIIAVAFALTMIALLTCQMEAGEGSYTSIEYDMSMFMKELFTPIFYPLYLYLFTYLLITLLYVVTIMKVYYAPLRSMGP